MPAARPNTPPDGGSASPPAAAATTMQQQQQQQQPLTKRDVRRNRILEKLQGMIAAFGAHQHQHYRAQLQAVQVDMTLVLRADPYADGQGHGASRGSAAAGGEEGDGEGGEEGVDGGLLGEDIAELVESVGANLPEDEAAQRDYRALAGSRYREFAQLVEDFREQRDADLTGMKDHYDSSVRDLERLTQQKLHQAEEEHKALTNSIRQRLIQSITKKRQQLLRDKEQLDVADSNALLLHPNHFNINNPGSPGGPGQNRKTRHLRHRAGSPNPGDLETNGKRKRKAAAVEDEGNESPAPAFKSLPAPDALGGGRSPFRDARDKNTYAQYEAPAYSLDRIFTEKELAMATDTAKMATWKYFNQKEQPEQRDHQNPRPGATSNPLDPDAMDTNADTDEAAAAPTTEGTPPPSAAPDMERSASHQVLTRGTARANPLAALSDLAAAAASAAPTRDNPFAPVIPSHHAVTRTEKSGAPAPSGVGALDLENDFEMMRRTRAAHGAGDPNTLAAAHAGADDGDDDAAASAQIRAQLLDQALGTSSVTQPYRLPLLESGPAVVGRGVDRIPATGFAPLISLEQRVARGGPGSLAAALQGKFQGGEAMSRENSRGSNGMGGLEAGGNGGAGAGGVGAAAGTGRGKGRRLV